VFQNFRFEISETRVGRKNGAKSFRGGSGGRDVSDVQGLEALGGGGDLDGDGVEGIELGGMEAAGGTDELRTEEPCGELEAEGQRV
jgi:hypothetical protein